MKPSGPWLIPVLLALLLLTPWPIFAVDVRPAMRPDRIAVPASGRTLSSAVAETFSRGWYFAVIDLHSGDTVWLANPHRQARHAAGIRCAYLLLREQVGVALVRKVGPEPFSNLTARGVRIYTVARGTTVREAIAAYSASGLRSLTRPTVAPHYGLERQRREAPQRQQPRQPPAGATPAALAPPTGSGAGFAGIEQL